MSVTNTNIFDDGDLNGDTFKIGDLGEVESFQKHRILCIPYSFPKFGEYKGRKKNAVTTEDIARVVHTNFNYLLSLKMSLTDENMAKISYIRYLVLREALANDEYDTSKHNVRYNEAKRWEDDDFEQERAKKYKDGTISDKIAVHLTSEWRTNIRLNFSNMICLIAYMFRVRGHHWLPDMDARYQELWRKIDENKPTPGLDWEFICHHATHAIMPDVLDKFWLTMSKTGDLNGVLVKRVNAAPAGAAIIQALYAGIQDLKSVVPGLRNQWRKEYSEVEDLIDRMNNEAQGNLSRWAGSINRRFYGGADLSFNESHFSGLAAVIISSLKLYAPDASLLKSMALLRAAGGAPLTGAFTAKMIAIAAGDERNAEALLKNIGDEESSGEDDD